MKIIELLNEDVPVEPRAPLYHTAPIIKAIHIVEQGSIAPMVPPEGKDPKNPLSGKPSVSLTRDPRLDYYNGKGPRVTFVIDQTQLRNLMKVHQIAFHSIGRRESEERVYKPVPLSVVNKLIVPKHELRGIEEYKQAYKERGEWINDDEWNGDSYNNLHWMLDQIIRWAHKNNVEVIAK